MKKIWLYIRNDRGQAMAEAAYVLPIATAIFLGILIFGYILFAKVVVVDTARDTARHVALGLPGTAYDKAKYLLKENQLDGDSLTAGDVIVDTTSDPNYVKVTVKYKQDVFLPGLSLLLGGGERIDDKNNPTEPCDGCIVLKHTAVFKKES